MASPVNADLPAEGLVPTTNGRPGSANMLAIPGPSNVLSIPSASRSRSHNDAPYGTPHTMTVAPTAGASRNASAPPHNGNAANSNAPDGEAPNGDTQYGNIHNGDARNGNARSGNARNSNANQYRGRGYPRQNFDPIQLTNTNLDDIASLGLKLSGLPIDVTTRDIYISLTAHNLKIVRIEIVENNLGFRNGNAKVDIEPAPSRWPPWKGSSNTCVIKRKDSGPCDVRVEVTWTNRLDSTTETPLDSAVPRQVSIKCDRMLFGMLANDNAMFELPQYEYRDVRLDFQFFRRIIQITFNVDMRRLGVKYYKLLIDFSHIKKLGHVKKEKGCVLTIELPSAPKLYAKMADVVRSHDDSLAIWQDRDSWCRQLEITHKPHLAKIHPAQLTKNRKTVDIARWTTYYLDIPAPGSDLVGTCCCLLEDYNVNIEDMENFDLVPPGESVWSILDEEPTDSYSWFNAIHLPFEVRYQLEACISQGLFTEYSIDKDFLDKLLTLESGQPRDLDRARMMLEGVADQNIKYYRPADIFNDPKIVNYWPTVKLPPQAAMIRRAVVTPTGVYFKTPGVELTNRVLRKYSDLTDRFLRVQFTDELSSGKLWSCQGSKQSDELYARVLRVLLNGVVIGDRHFQILAWSNSQFREHGAFFFCANDHISCNDIREKMGNLKHIQSVGKFAARMGQCFTTTRSLSGVSVPKIVAIKDIERETDGTVWNFTDGVGKISPFFARMIAHEQGMWNIPSCFQFRMGGCKGVLVVWHDVQAGEVHIRPSQEKFKAPYNGLEIIKVSAFSHATLNRQIIPILSCLGVEDKMFMALLEEELRDYESALSESWKASALLRKRVDENQTSLVLADMVETFMDKKEPFISAILSLWKCWALQRLKLKAAITVKKSAFLFGCVDELGVLRGHSKDTEGKEDQNKDALPQIFLQVPIKEGLDPTNQLSYEVVTGVCIVGRNPSLHPGDIRVVEAVDIPGLRHLKDVVVFPQTGDRDVPSMCSGGDLDGDDFFVIWDERLLPKEWNFPPMNHDVDPSGTGEKRVVDDVNIHDMCAFFAQYIKNDCVGLVATAHFAWADLITPKGEKCLELAKLHSMAVDYIKSGKEAIMHRSLGIKRSPHWLERSKSKNTYKSHTPVGQIYDKINVEKFDPAYDLPFDSRILSRFEHTAEELVKAKELKGRYDIAMRRLMGQHERPISEFEIWSTFVLSKPRVGSDYKMQEQVGRDIAALKDRFRRACGEAVSGVAQTYLLFSYADIDLAQFDRFVAAMYKVTHEEVQEALEARAMPVLDEEGNRLADNHGDDFPMPLISFPWLFHAELGRIAQGGVPRAQWQRKKPTTTEENLPRDAAKIESLLGAAKLDDDKPKVMSKKEGAQIITNDVITNIGPADSSLPEDCVRTASGKIVHRGEILGLFDDKGEVVVDGTHTPPSESTVAAVESMMEESESEDDDDDLEQLVARKFAVDDEN